MIRALLVDDEPLAREGLRRLCDRDGRLQVIGEARDGASALERVEAERPDAVFLDIGMPGLSGLAVASRLRTASRPPLIVFVTAYDYFAIDAFDLAVVDYVLKPVETERLVRAVDRVERWLATRPPEAAHPPQEFWAPTRGGMVRVDVTTIDRIDAERDYVRLHVGARSFLLRQPISATEARLDARLFVRLHRSTIVRRDRIRELRHLGRGAWVAVDVDGRSLRVGRSHLARARAILCADVAGA